MRQLIRRRIEKVWPLAMLLLGLALLVLLVLLLWKVPEWRVAAVNYTGPSAAHDRMYDENAARTTLAQIIGGGVLLIGLYFTARNVQIAQRNLHATEEGKITDRFSKAIEQLGSDKLEIRLGGIYALERVARDSAPDHWPVMEVLTAYVREHAPFPPKVRQPTVGAAGHDLGDQRAVHPRIDIQAILTVIVRRQWGFDDGEKWGLDLHGTDLRGAELREANLREANLREANLTEANLTEASLRKADLTGADLTGAFLIRADLTEAFLPNAILTGTHLSKAHLTGAFLMSAFLTGTSLLRAFLTGAHLTEAHLTGAHLDEADLTGAHLMEADLTRATLTRATLTRADLTRADLTETNLMQADLRGAILTETNLTETNLTLEQLKTARPDERTILPRHLRPPEPSQAATTTEEKRADQQAGTI